MDVPFLLRWGGVSPPYHKYGVFIVCGAELCISALSMAIGQKYYELATIFFPIAMDMFDYSVQKSVPGFVWTSNERRTLFLHEQKLLMLWCSSTVVVVISMALIVPFFFKFGKEKKKNRCISRKTIMGTCAVVFLSAVFVNAVIVFWLYITVAGDHNLFYSLFDAALKEETFLTEIEKALDCISDDDKELPSPATECDNSVNRSVISRKWFKPFVIIWIVGHCVAFFLFGFANKDFGDEEEEDDELYGGYASKKLVK